jgi:hypothetical protein
MYEGSDTRFGVVSRRAGMAASSRAADRRGPVCVTLVGGTCGQLGEKSRFQNAAHWPFSLG